MNRARWFGVLLGLLAVAVACSQGEPASEAGATGAGGTGSGSGCRAGQAECNGACVEVQSSAAHCGGCDVACGSDQVCSKGTCATSCANGLTQCGADCVSLQSDGSNCGSCGTVCQSGATCSRGSCANGSGGTTGSGGTGGSGGFGDDSGAGGNVGSGGSSSSGGTSGSGGSGGDGGSVGNAGSGGAGGSGGTPVVGDYYVSPTGDDSNPGTVDAPFKTVGRAQSAASAGKTVLIRGGTYAFSGSGTVGVAFTKSGSANNPIKYFAYPGETPVFDLGDLTPSNRVTGLDVNCSYIHLRGLEVKGVHQYMSGQDSWGVRIRGNDNVLEDLDVHHNDAPGIFITSGANNQILNCDSHHNYDVLESGGSGDGFGCHSSGSNNLFSGCRAYDNSDDGFDFINAAGSCIVEKSFAFRNGYVPGTTATAGNGAGFKAGGYGSPPSVPSSGAATHTVRQCVAFSNRSQGFYANHHPGKINFYNNTAFGNGANYNLLADSGYPSSHDLRNNVAMSPGGTISNLSGGSATYNSWNLSVTVSSADFASVDQAQALSPRNADGSLPEVDFMRLVNGSDLIDAGQNVGLPYEGSAPDLGAFEN